MSLETVKTDELGELQQKLSKLGSIFFNANVRKGGNGTWVVTVPKPFMDVGSVLKGSKYLIGIIKEVQT